MASAVLTGEFTATGESTWIALRGEYNLSLMGGVGTVRLEKSYDGGITVFTVSKNTDGDPASYALVANDEISLVGIEPESGIIYRLVCTAYTSGTIPYRLSQ